MCVYKCVLLMMLKNLYKRYHNRPRQIADITQNRSVVRFSSFALLPVEILSMLFPFHPKIQ